MTNIWTGPYVQTGTTRSTHTTVIFIESGPTPGDK
jgi:hypothetical protein